MKKITCPINPKTTKKYECQDCKYRDACIEDILNDLQDSIMRKVAKSAKRIGRLLKERRGL